VILRVYLSGSTRQGKRDLRSSDHFWSEAHEEIIRGSVNAAEVEFLSAMRGPIELTDNRACFGGDLSLIRSSDLVLVDARTEKGIGVGAEMMFAAYESRPVVTWLPRGSPYLQCNARCGIGSESCSHIHPFIYGLSDYIVENLSCVANLVNKLAVEGYLELRKSVSRAITQFEALQGCSQ
jgi:hypothetical protein